MRSASPQAFMDLLARVSKSFVLLVIAALCLFLLLSLLGYHPKDPGWSHLGYHPEVQNWTGKGGALVSDIAFSFLGVAAWLIPFVIGIPIIRFMIRGEISLLDGLPFVMLRALGVLLIVTTLSTLASIHVSNASLGYSFTSGGLLGEAISDVMVSWFSILGSSVLLLATLLIGLTFYLECSWGQMLDAVGNSVLKVGSIGQLFKFKPKPTKGPETSVQERAESLREQFKQRFEQPKARPVAQSGNTAAAAPTATPLTSTPVRDNTEYDLDKSHLSLSANRSFDVNESTGELLSPPVQTTEEVDIPVVTNVVSSSTNPTFDEGTKAAAPTIAGIPVVDPVTPKPSSLTPTGSVGQGNPLSTEQKKALKIVPLAETHQPIKTEDEVDLNTPAMDRRPARSIQKIPSMDLLDPPELHTETGYTDEQLEDMSRLLESKLKDFGVVAEVVEVNPGPVITRFEIQPAPGVKASKITNLSKDLARSLAVLSVRVVEVIPGKSVMGIEIPNETRQMVRLSEVLNSKSYKESSSRLSLGLGNDIAGNPVVTNLAKMPHLLVAGTTGSGKSVGVNAMLLSLLYKATPEEVRLMMVDPKMLELSIYEGIPHLLTPVITDMKEAAGGLRWCVGEMERRYRLMAKMGVRNLAGFNDKVKAAEQRNEPIRDPLWKAEEHGEPEGTPAPYLESLPYIVVVIDEFADMMMIVGKKVEELIARIAQKARAAGIHLILATQRPSVDVITGLIKANVPTRIAFQVSSKIDSRTILDQSGAENLLGNGDMLYLPAGTSVPNRVHGAFVSDDEVHRVVEAWKQLGSPVYIDSILDESSGDATMGSGGGLFDEEQDALYDEAVAFVTETRKASISSVQRKLKIGYNRAARMIETMEAAGVVTEAGSNGQREVLAPPPVRN